MRPVLIASLFASTALFAGCDDHLYPQIGESGNVTYPANWDGMQQFMGDHCESCHPLLAPPAMPDDIAADIVDGTGRYVVPFDPDNSELWLVVIDESEQTAIMPLGSAEPLPADVTQPIYDWIAAGAPLD